MIAQRKHLEMPNPEKLLTERLIYWKRDLPVILGVSYRTIDRWISCNEFPAPDVSVQGKAVWRRETIQRWCGAQGA